MKERAHGGARSRVLVTGGAGYIGSWVTRRLLEAGYEVVVLDSLIYGGESLLGVLGHPNFGYVRGDIRDPKVVREAMAGAEKVVHLAAIVGEAACDRDPDRSRSINLEGTRTLFHAAKELRVRQFVFFSTCSSYGVQDTSAVADEDTPLRPVSLYARTKIEAERFLTASAEGGTYVTILRPSTVHGSSARMRFDLIVNHMVLESVEKGEISVYGPDMWRPLMWVGDAAQAVEAVLGAEPELVRNQVFNVGSNGANFRKIEIAESVRKSILPGLRVKSVPQSPDLRSYRVDFSKIAERLGFTLIKPLDRAIREIYELLVQGIIQDPRRPEFRND